MKKTPLVLALGFLSCFTLYAQDNKAFEMQTLSSSSSSVGGYGSLNTNISSFRDRGMVSMGVNGACVLNHSFAIGIEGYGVLPSMEFNDYTTLDTSITTTLTGGWGGLHFEGIFSPEKAIHFVIPVSGGAGWLGYLNKYNSSYYDNDPYYNDGLLMDDTFFWYIEPGVGVEMNIAKFFRIYLGATYKFTTGLDLKNTSDNELDKLNGRLLLKFGKF